MTNGPDLRVILVPNGDPQEADDITGYLELEPLRGNVGNQNYEIPPDVDLSQYGSVVIYCKPFHVLFAVASLET
ncbi:MAG: DM13 domain-containing protein [Acidimicrobiia bacterium]